MTILLVTFDSPRPWTLLGCARYLSLIVFLAAIDLILLFSRDLVNLFATEQVRTFFRSSVDMPPQTVFWLPLAAVFLANLLIVARAATFAAEIHRNIKAETDAVLSPGQGAPTALVVLSMIPTILKVKTPIDRLWESMTLRVVDAQSARLAAILDSRSHAIAAKYFIDGAYLLAQDFDVTFLVRDRDRTEADKAKVRKDLSYRATEPGQPEQVRVRAVLSIIQREDVRGDYFGSRAFRKMWKKAKQ